MAGSYPNVPSRRMAWDDDGSVVLAAWADRDVGTPGLGEPPELTLVDQSAVNKQKINDESNDQLGVDVWVVTTGGMFWYIFFPEKRELDGYYNNYSTEGVTAKYLTWSEDSTNGRDGTYTAWGTQTMAYNADVDPDYREDINSSALSNKTSVYSCMWVDTGVSQAEIYLRAFHVYGRITPGETPDRLIFLDTENLDAQYTVLIDYGNIPRGQTQTKTIKIKNNSASLVAATVQLTAVALTGASDDWYSFSVAGGAYQATGQLGTLGPGETKEVSYKQAVPDAEQLGLHAARFKANQASWS